MKVLVIILALCLLPLLGSAAPDAPPAFPSVETKALPNAHRVTDKLISGAQPEGEEGFKYLKELGIKTIVSVDGAKPDVELARKYGLRYVHLPITYSGVTDDEGRNIAKALAELPGPIYLHCHHGKHRSAAAVAVACVMNGMIKPEQAESVLKTFGTGENYLGLWKAARDAKPLSERELGAVKVDYVEQAKIPELAERMVEVDARWDTMKAFQKNAWRPLKDQPKLDAAHEALQLQEHFREAGRAEDMSKRPAKFHDLLNEADAGAEALQKALSAKPLDTAVADAAFKRVANSCAACHKSFRD